jgi:4-hydroxy-tetrahydrodipicolinate synthase
MSKSQNLIPEGIIAACPTPMLADLTVDHELLADHCRWLLANGCGGVALLGSTGEANSFSVMERIEILEKLEIAGIPGDRVIVGTGCCAIPDTVLLTKHALSLGITTVLVLPPFYYKKVDEDGLFDSYGRIITKVDDERLNILLYHNPKVSGIPISSGLIERLISSYPDTVVGMKDSGGDWSHMKGICETFPAFKVFTGSETFLFDILKAGGVGSISATLNVTAKPAAEIIKKQGSGEAPSLQKKLSQLRSIFEHYPLIAGVKYILSRISSNSHWTNLRPPLSPLTKKDADHLTRALINAKTISF